MKLNKKEKKLIAAAMLIHEYCKQHKENCWGCIFEFNCSDCMFTDYVPIEYNIVISRILGDIE